MVTNIGESSTSVRCRIEALFAKQVTELVESEDFRALESGRATPAAYDRFIANVARAHLKSPQLLAFLFALAPPDAARHLQDNMLEELGMADDTRVAHPALLEVLARGAGLGPLLSQLEAAAAADIRRVVTEPLLYGTLREVGLAALGEITAFEFMLARVAGRMARALTTHRGLDPETLAWFTHHAEVDVRHAEQGLDTLAAYIRYYEFSDEEALLIVETALRANVFLRRYFAASPPSSALAPPSSSPAATAGVSAEA